jgi:hypothetical protein
MTIIGEMTAAASVPPRRESAARAALRERESRRRPRRGGVWLGLLLAGLGLLPAVATAQVSASLGASPTSISGGENATVTLTTLATEESYINIGLAGSAVRGTHYTITALRAGDSGVHRHDGRHIRAC